jgi:hypothetical protein
MSRDRPKGGHGRPAVIVVDSTTTEIYEHKWRRSLFDCQFESGTHQLFYFARKHLLRKTSMKNNLKWGEKMFIVVQKPREG